MKKTFFILIVGVFIVSASSIIIRWTDNVSFAAISFYRLTFSLPFLITYSFFRKPSVIKLKQHFQWPYILAGFFLAAHFITWIASLQLTTIANSIFLQGTHPIFALIISILILKEIPKLSILPAFLMAFIGMFLIVYSDFHQEWSQLTGDFLAILSALMVALYLLIARMFKHKTDLISYLIVVYGAAAVFCAFYMQISGVPFKGYSWKNWGLMFLLALGPNLIGHSLFNWASRKIEIYKVNLMLVLEPVLATLGGMIFFTEFPNINFYPGAILIILAVILITVQEDNRK